MIVKDNNRVFDDKLIHLVLKVVVVVVEQDMVELVDQLIAFDPDGIDHVVALRQNTFGLIVLHRQCSFC